MLQGYETHLPVLTRACQITQGPILELGCGDSSTPLVHQWATRGRLVVSAESDPLWLERFKVKYASDRHLFSPARDWRDFDEIEKRFDWSVALIDCAPGEDRADLANRLAFRCEFVILHDSETDGGGNYRYERCRGNFKYAVEYVKLRPQTLILSNVRRFPVEECE